MSSDNTFVCPSCRQLDRVQKVSSIVSSGTASISTTSASGTSTIELARKLAKPSEPSGGCYQCGQYLYVFYLIIGIIIFIPGAALIIFSIINYRGILGLIGTSIISLPLTLSGLFLTIYYWKNYSSHAQAVRVRLEEVMQEYNKRSATWNAMFYCYRCDGVFTRSSRFAPIANVAEFLSKG